MHHKEKAIALLLNKRLGVNCFTSAELNTDLLGTFSGEVERLDNPIETARKKCLHAILLTGCDLAVSSEGSFGPHPTIGFFPCDEEILFLYDKKNDLEILVKELSTKTNFSGESFDSLEELKEFAGRSQFPSHALIIKDLHDSVIEKGIKEWDRLEIAFNKAKEKGMPVKVETDMRAHFNPTRMVVIEKCAHKLVDAIESLCPKCQLPGFIPCKAEPGLPCEQCNMPTRSTLKFINTCKGCGYTKEIMHPHKKQFEEPTFCDFCNP